MDQDNEYDVSWSSHPQNDRSRLDHPSTADINDLSSSPRMSAEFGSTSPETRCSDPRAAKLLRAVWTDAAEQDQHYNPTSTIQVRSGALSGSIVHTTTAPISSSQLGLIEQPIGDQQLTGNTVCRRLDAEVSKQLYGDN